MIPELYQLSYLAFGNGGTPERRAACRERGRRITDPRRGVNLFFRNGAQP